MKRILWFSSIAVIFLETLSEVAFPFEPLQDLILAMLCVCGTGFMFYVFFLEKKTSTIVSVASLVFGIAGAIKLATEFVVPGSFLVNIILLGITISLILIVFLPAFIGRTIKE
jgi:hypothetical protein